MQTIDMVLSLYQDNVPIRFGIIMYSSRLINGIEESDGTLPVNDGEDTSILVIICSFSIFFFTAIS
jgi:UDP-glucose:glycoprotein glucosyltransferase